MLFAGTRLPPTVPFARAQLLEVLPAACLRNSLVRVESDFHAIRRRPIRRREQLSDFRCHSRGLFEQALRKWLVHGRVAADKEPPRQIIWHPLQGDPDNRCLVSISTAPYEVTDVTSRAKLCGVPFGLSLRGRGSLEPFSSSGQLSRTPRRRRREHLRRSRRRPQGDDIATSSGRGEAAVS